MKTRLSSASSGSRECRISSSIEPLEPRVAPAVVILNPHTATYTDIDGDHVTINVSKGTLTPANFLTAPKLEGEQLQLIAFSGGGFDDANLTVSVKRVAGGDGLAHVGFISSFGHDLGAVTIRGDLGYIDVGDGNTADGAIKSLSVQSMGRFGEDTQPPAIGGLQSNINGALGKLSVRDDIIGVRIEVLAGGIGSITIGGSLIGGDIFSTGDVGPVKITHDLLGGSEDRPGRIFVADGKLTSLSIGGSLIGGSGKDSGEIFSRGNMGTVKIEGDLLGGSGEASGNIDVRGKLASASIGGSIVGGSGPVSGVIFSQGDMGVVKIRGDLRGGSITGTESLDSSGFIHSANRIAGVSIGGSIISGIDTSSGTLFGDASIQAGDDIGFIAIKGSIVGNSVGDASPVSISARGQADPGAKSDIAIGKITVGGRMEFARVLAGYDVLLAVNGNASIGPVKVGGDWVASDLVAGVAAGADGQFGTGDDASIGGTLAARIASILIGGQVVGTPSNLSTTDHFGFVAEAIGSFKTGPAKATLRSSSGDVVELSPTTGDVILREV